ncbi:hypothetical protein FHX57_006794 [Paraburkholderia tropica]|uniref:DUF7296 family protein n=1 Tax=Paraburkholderia tropica TaxID=92647 RepID=UPI0016203E75|nr:hypothetical protein [Paraburkholderia tropica]MBB3004412.1 hypothetical protein [Paraburkholderia tropica]
MEQTVTVNLKWFRFGQNNSGGYFVEDENVCEDVYVQARSAEEAIAKAETFCDNSDSCPCCGDRWSFWVDDSDGTDEPMRYGEPVRTLTKGLYSTKAKLHHFDGTIETIKLQDA